MLIRAAKEITNISDDPNIYSQNYMESLDYIDNLFLVLNKVKLVLPVSDIKFLPTFKGRKTSERNNITSSEVENTMKYFRIISPHFIEDLTKKKLEEILTPICNMLSFDGDAVTIILK